MKLTIEKNRDALKRYAHVKPAPRWGGAPCSAKLPGTIRACSLKVGHSGPHVAHGMFGRVVAVWDEGPKSPHSLDRARRSMSSLRRRRRKEGKVSSSFKALLTAPSIEEVALLIMALFFVGFAIDWALRILGVW